MPRFGAIIYQPTLRVRRIDAAMGKDLFDDERRACQAEVDRLREEHRDLDAALQALLDLGRVDQLQIQRFKKRKLALRDRLAYLEDQVTPDIIA